ncbi:hypothetical protein VSR01_10575 [Actinacidiphila sp. DG2A-62]|uniref:hypothetical protein n=1 Tax=Actinacidiphila sp. DG2A-62 TaxID=3108821 RepID=UPI002DBDE52E|nr:hypothetical protein [Actinacidiphila sp. DG2A-62]MEC3993962.1 hypothetical protein [Actinacidiphila sp. DG2A-62]
MKNLTIGITPAAVGRPARLRADQIRRDTLTMLAAALAEDADNSLRNALDELIDAAKQDAPAEDISLLVQDIEDLADMGQAAMNLTAAEVGQLAAEAWQALPVAPADSPTAPQPRPDWVRFTEPTQQSRRAS